MTLTEFAWAVYVYCTLAEASVTSWIRTRPRNDRQGGVLHSAHLVGLGVDVVYDEPPSLAERDEWADRLGLKLIAEGDHDHVQPKGWRAG